VARLDNASRTGVDRLALLISTVGGVGHAPLAPGTVASALTALALGVLSPSRLALAVILLAVILVGTWAAQEAERSLGGKDPGAIVVDEVAGMALAVLTVPLTPAVLIAGFVLFRVFDIVKPYPANALQRLPGGVGVMIDDLVAGLYALLLLVLARALVGWP
jgi:phosphatidylglycerophosphatase A